MADVITVERADVPGTPDTVHLQYTNLFDHATSLPGWPLLIDRTRIALARAARNDLHVAVVVFDDVRRRSSASPDFTACVAALHESVFPDDTLARIGGRTFVFVLNDVRDAGALADAADEIVERLGIDCHVGIACGSLPCDPEELINQARQDAVPPPPPPPLPLPRWEDQFLATT
jgi:hypothetical protein